MEGKVDEDSNISLVELDMENTSTKLAFEVKRAEPSQKETSSTCTQN